MIWRSILYDIQKKLQKKSDGLGNLTDFWGEKMETAIWIIAIAVAAPAAVAFLGALILVTIFGVKFIKALKSVMKKYK